MVLVYINKNQVLILELFHTNLEGLRNVNCCWWQIDYRKKIIGNKRKAYKNLLNANDLWLGQLDYLKKKIRASGDNKNKRDYKVSISRVSKQDPKLILSYLRNNKTVRDNIGKVLDGFDNFVSDKKGMASVLNQEFSKVNKEENNRALTRWKYLTDQKKQCYP